MITKKKLQKEISYENINLNIWAMKKTWLVRLYRGLYYPLLQGLLYPIIEIAINQPV